MEIPSNIDDLPVDQLITIAKDQLLILDENSGYGFGVCAVANSMAWSMMVPESKEKDWKSIVALQAPLEKYTRDDLIKILKLAKKETDKYDKYFNIRMGANIHIFNKRVENTRDVKPWFYKRLSYTMGTMWYESLDEIITFLSKN